MPDISDSTNWSELDGANNQAPPNGWPEGMMPSGVNDAARANMGALKRFWNRANPMQSLTPTGGGNLWQFNTVNPAYPTSYVNGELYTFRPTAASLGGDEFQVNTLGFKPIWKRIYGGPWSPIGVQDIAAFRPPMLVYDATLNSGSGAFVLINPFYPIQNDGAGGISMPGNLNVGGGTITANVLNTTALTVVGPGQPLHVSGGGALFDGGITVSSGTSSFATLTATTLTALGSVGGVGLNVAAGSIQTSGGINQVGTGPSTLTGQLTLSATGTALNVPSGTVLAQGGTSVFSSINVGSTILGASGNMSVFGDVTINGGGLALNVANGNLQVQGTTTLIGATSTGTLTVGGPGQPLHVVGGGALFDGGITVSSGLSTVADFTINGHLQDNGSTANFVGISSGTVTVSAPSGTSLTVAANAQIGGTLQVTSTLNALASVSITSNLAVGASGNGAIVVPNGGITIGGGMYPLQITNGGINVAADIITHGLKSQGNVIPFTDNAFVCGGGGFAWIGVSSYLYTTVSDRALKADLAELPPCLALVGAIRPARYRWKDGPDQRTHWGFVAQEIETVMAAAGLDFGGHQVEEGRHLLAYQELIPILWKAVQELTARLLRLEEALP